MLKSLIIAILIALPVVASAHTTDKFPKNKAKSGFNYKKHYRKQAKHKRKMRRSPACRAWAHNH
jgi:hypothetical protein